MHFEFNKYHGNGNDFVIINNLENTFSASNQQIANICDRRFGIGADGFILINRSEVADFEMLYYNSDGNLASLCGNGGRCAAAFAYAQGFVDEKMAFIAYDGRHKAVVNHQLNNESSFDISLEMKDVEEVEINDNYFFLNTGSPHYVEFVDQLADFDLVNMGRKTRYSEKFQPHGTNANFAEISDDRIFVRTYERGVEDETLSCGTGVTATAIAAYQKTGMTNVNIHTAGGDFKVSFEVKAGKYTNLWLRGPAVKVFNGKYIID